VLLSAAQVAELLGGGISAKVAAGIMDEWDVPCVHLGAGRTRGRRWRRAAVLAAIAEKEREPKGKAAPRAPRRRTSSICGMSCEEFCRALTPDKPVH